MKLSAYVSFLAKWQDAGQWGDWTFSIVAGVLPPSISAVFQLLLPYLIRKLTKYQGAVRLFLSPVPIIKYETNISFCSSVADV